MNAVLDYFAEVFASRCLDGLGDCSLDDGHDLLEQCSTSSWGHWGISCDGVFGAASWGVVQPLESRQEIRIPLQIS